VGAMGILLAVSATLVGGTVLLTRQMTEAHRAIVEGAVPAVRLELELLETVSALRRIEARHLVLRDQAFRTLFLDRAQAALGDVDRLESLLDGQAKARAREIRALLAIYRDRMERGGLSRVGGTARRPGSRSSWSRSTRAPPPSSGVASRRPSRWRRRRGGRRSPRWAPRSPSRRASRRSPCSASPGRSADSRRRPGAWRHGRSRSRFRSTGRGRSPTSPPRSTRWPRSSASWTG